MVVNGRIKKGEYFDSVSLMVVGKEVAALEGVIDAAVVMGTKENKAILRAAGLLIGEFEGADDTDLLIAVKAKSGKAAREVQEKVDGLLDGLKKKKGAAGEEYRPRSIEGALKALPDANLALISVAGRYAGDEAMKALEKGLHVMLFSDNVSIEKEIELKNYAKEKGLLVMGPDCGTAIINGAPLAFANVVSRGAVGLVGASGTGLQEVASIISNEGCGVSQAIGTGGRDVKREVGGVMFLEGLKALAQDEATEVIVLVSKPPHKEVLERIGKELGRVKKPVVSVFLGAEPGCLKKYGVHGTATLEEAAMTAVALAKGKPPREAAKLLRSRDKELKSLAEKAAARRGKGQKYLRGLFSGGTFCTEAEVVFEGVIRPLYSNAPAGKALKLEDALKSRMHTVVDLGADEFTVGRPHPMIDYSLRNRRIAQEAGDPETAVILLDVVLGYGSNPDPAAELAPVIREASKNVAIVCFITGTDKDPQGRKRVEKALKAAGALMAPTSTAGCRLAADIVRQSGAGRGKNTSSKAAA
ncbi:MAG: acyl-CoA synthetase FdrA [Elusimicrobiota bacterium]